ncbi:MAG: tetratricopeptide repeat protein [Bacteroidetes bacterium]|nr:tetratricopeptide repeat protein [Bacteroidota bacterium]
MKDRHSKRSWTTFSHILFLFVIATILCGHSYAQKIVDFKQIGINEIRKGQFIEALGDINMAIQKEPYNADLYYLRGIAKSNLEDFIGADEDYSRSLELSPLQPDVLINRAIVRSQKHNFSGALSDLEEALKLDTANAEIYFDLARIKFYLKKYYACISDCKRAIALKYPAEYVYIIKGSSELELVRYSEAIEDLNKAISINPANTYSYIQLGSVWMEQTQPDSAIIAFNRAIRIDSNSVYALFNRALALIKKTDHKGAMADLTKVIRLSPYNSYAYFDRAIVFQDMNDKKSAIRDYDVVIKLNPKNIMSYFYRGMLKAELNDPVGALEDLDKTIELYPDFAYALYERYQIRLKVNDHHGAQEDYEKAIELGKKSNLSADSLRWKQEKYLQSLVKLSGDFEEMNTMNSKLQNQFVDIQLIPLYYLMIGKAGFDKLSLYDAYQKPHYFSDIITLTNQPDIIRDSTYQKEVAADSRRLDSLKNITEWLVKRAVSLTGLQKFDAAFCDYDSLFRRDTTSVLAWFCRATSRFAFIRYMQKVNDYRDQITIANTAGKSQKPVPPRDPEHTFEAVVHDLDQAIRLDPDFIFAYYNRGYIKCLMGNYPGAIRDFTGVIERKPNFAEALYNRGLLYILLNDITPGCTDLSRAGELGIQDAYKVMKRYCHD